MLLSFENLYACSQALALIISFQTIQSQNLADSASLYTSEFNKLTKEHGSDIWGMPIGAPIIFINENQGLAYLSQSSDDTNEIMHGDIFILPLDSEMMISKPVVEWKKIKWVAVYLPYQQSKRQLLEFIAHESFHCIQNELSIEGIMYGLPHLSSIQGKTLMQIELIELLKALQSVSDEEQRSEHILNALALRNHRYKKYPEARLLEGKAELSEGLAVYTGKTYVNCTQQQLIDHYKKSIKKLETLQVEGAYPYTSGSLYSFLNDKKDKSWRKKIPKSFIYEITTEIYGVENEDEQEMRVNTLLKSSEYINIPDFFSHSTVEGLKEIFSKNRLYIETEKATFQFSSNLVVSIPNVGTVYNNITINDEWGVLEVAERGRVLISIDNDIILSNDSLEKMDKFIKGLGWQINIKKGWQLTARDNDHYLIKSED